MKGTYALALGNELRTLGDGSNAAAAGQSARSAHPDDLQATLIAFIDSAGKAQDDARRGGGSAIGALDRHRDPDRRRSRAGRT